MTMPVPEEEPSVHMPVPEGAWTVLGLPLHREGDDDDIAQPLEALVVIKGLDSEAQLHYWAIRTPDLGLMEARGMADWLKEVVIGAE